MKIKIIIITESQSRVCTASKLCRTFTHENSSCSMHDMTSQLLTQCQGNRIHNTRGNDDTILRYVAANAAGKIVTFSVLYNIYNCTRREGIGKDMLRKGLFWDSYRYLEKWFSAFFVFAGPFWPDKARHGPHKFQFKSSSIITQPSSGLCKYEL